MLVEHQATTTDKTTCHAIGSSFPKLTPAARWKGHTSLKQRTSRTRGKNARSQACGNLSGRIETKNEQHICATHHRWLKRSGMDDAMTLPMPILEMEIQSSRLTSVASCESLKPADKTLPWSGVIMVHSVILSTSAYRVAGYQIQGLRRIVAWTIWTVLDPDSP